MLNDDVIDKLVDRIEQRINKANEYIIEQIGESINKLGALSPSKANQLVNILKYGGDYNKIVKELSRITKLNIKEINEIFDEVAKSDYRFAKQFYEYRNKPYVPFDENKALVNQVNVIKEASLEDFANISNTKMLGYGIKQEDGTVIFKGLKETYNDILDEVIININQGKESTSEGLKRTIEAIGESGLKVIYPSGYTRRLDSSIRMNILDGINKVHNTTQEVLGKQFGSDGIEITAHINPAKDHEKLQGRQFSMKEYEKLNNGQEAKAEDGTIIPANKRRRPISTMNCRHRVFHIVLGVSKPRYTDEQLDKIIEDNEKGFTYEGNHYTNYEGTQLQRQLELKIRKENDKIIMAEKIQDPDIDAIRSKAEANIKIYKKKRRELQKLIYGGT